jgi:serine/threonine protein kinase
LLLQTSLIREATLMRKLQHPNVLQLHTSFVVGRELWLVMPYMAHGSVRSIMKKQGLTQVCNRLAGSLVGRVAVDSSSSQRSELEAVAPQLACRGAGAMLNQQQL